MSFWMKAKCVVADLETFTSICEEYGIKITPKQNVVRASEAEYSLEMGGRMVGYLCNAKNGKGYEMVYDQDKHYSPLAAKVGRNGGLIMRDYIRDTLKKKLSREGMMVRSSTTDRGDIVLKAAVNG